MSYKVPLKQTAEDVRDRTRRDDHAIDQARFRSREKVQRILDDKKREQEQGGCEPRAL